jgi:DNA-directed RNA polymerase specialized sigma subunit
MQQDLTSLNKLYADYQAGNLGKRELEGEMFRIILENIQNFHLFDGDEEESTDYLCWLYPRLSRAIANYQDSGAAFSTYIGALIRYSMKEYRSRKIDHYITEYAAWTAHITDLEVRSPVPAYAETVEEEEELPPRINLPLLKSRQVLLLILKSYHFISEDFIDRIAPYAGVEREKLKEMIEKLRLRRSRREEDIRVSQERIATQFYRCITWEKRLKLLLPGSARYGKVQIQLERARVRLAGMRKRLSQLRVDATHEQIAEVLGISRGTVSSSLFKLRSYWEPQTTGTAEQGATAPGIAVYPSGRTPPC